MWLLKNSFCHAEKTIILRNAKRVLGNKHTLY